MRPFCRRLHLSTNCPRAAAAGWYVPSRSLSEAAAARREQQQRKAERTTKLLEQFKQRARATTTQPSQPPALQLPSQPPPSTSPSAQPQPSFFRAPTVARQSKTTTQPLRRITALRKQPSGAEERVDDIEDEDDVLDDSDIGLTTDGVSGVTKYARQQADRLRALIERRKLAHDERRNHPDVQHAPPLAALYKSATTPTTTTPATSTTQPPRAKPQQRVLALSILGLPNSGKSSLTNRICHNHITAVSPKSHTTRGNVTGIHTNVSRHVQLVIHDTPGVLGRHDGKRHERDMSVAAWMAAGDVNVVLVCVDGAKRWSESLSHMFAELTAMCRTHHTLTPILVLNKVDLVHPKRELLSIAQQCVDACRYIKDVYYISLTDDDGVDDLIDALYAKAKPGEWEYESHVVSDMSPLERVEEVIREKLYMRYNKELPYTIEQRHMTWNEGEDWIRVEQQLRVDSEAQRSIVIGGRGSGVEWVKREAERVASEMLGKQVQLYLNVQVGKKKEGVAQYS